MPKRSAGLLMYRRRDHRLEVFLVHFGGPFWAKKDVWSIPKGEYSEGESALEAAKREFEEETGFTADGEFLELGDMRQTGGKIVTAWAFEGDCNPGQLKSNRFVMEWPPRSGRREEFPEVDRGDWFPIDAARGRIVKGQAQFLDRLVERVGESG